MIALHDCSPEDRRQSIECAARVLESTWPKLQHSATVQIAGRPVQVLFLRLPSGAVRVAHRNTGAIVAQSVPALLSVPDPELFPGNPPEGDDAAFSMVADRFGRADLLRVLAEVLERPHFRGLTAPEIAYVLTGWADQLNDD